MGMRGFGFLGFFIFTMCSQWHMTFTPRGGIGLLLSIMYFHYVHNILQVFKMFIITLHFYHISCAERCVLIMYISKPKGKTLYYNLILRVKAFV